MQEFRKQLMSDFGCCDNDQILAFSGEYRFLSNFWVCPVTVGGLFFTSSEHAYMAQKTNDLELRELIRSQASASNAKKLGRKIPLRTDWEDVKIQVMFDVVFAKFPQNEFLKKKLLDTGNRYLEEGNTWNDVFWGVCSEKGLNSLGQVLMLVRSTLRDCQYELKR